MERGLLWLPLLVLFFWLAWAGWNEYQKLEAYKVWAEGFERAKYDILAALGQSGATLSWGHPTRKGIIDLQTISRPQITSIQVWVRDSKTMEQVDITHASPDSLAGRRSEIRLQLTDTTISIPFTDAALALQWGRFLQGWLETASLDSPVD